MRPVVESRQDECTIDEGYLLIAVGAQKYADMAVNCAKSIRHFDPKRPIQILADGLSFSKQDSALFDYIDRFDRQARFRATLSKLAMNTHSRFKKTLFVDADCLMFGDGIDDHWRELSKYSVGVPGVRLTEGEWWGADISELLKETGLPYIVQMNSGVVYFDDSKKSHQLFSTARSVLRKYGHFITVFHTGAHPDEPFFGLAFGYREMEPYPIVHNRVGCLMVSTINGSGYAIDLDHENFSFLKGQRHVSPSLVHFSGLQPQDEYAKLCQYIEGKRYTRTVPVAGSR